jgi:hypothetical protein
LWWSLSGQRYFPNPEEVRAKCEVTLPDFEEAITVPEFKEKTKQVEKDLVGLVSW